MNCKRIFLLGLTLAYLLTACAILPKPAECKGAFRPINSLEKSGIEPVQAEKLVSCKEGSNTWLM